MIVRRALRAAAFSGTLAGITSTIALTVMARAESKGAALIGRTF